MTSNRIQKYWNRISKMTPEEVIQGVMDPAHRLQKWCTRGMWATILPAILGGAWVIFAPEGFLLRLSAALLLGLLLTNCYFFGRYTAMFIESSERWSNICRGILKHHRPADEGEEWKND